MSRRQIIRSLSRRAWLRGPILAAAILLVCSGCGSAHPAVPGLSAGQIGSYGSVLTSASGQPLYAFIPDMRKQVTCHDECAHTWPPLFTAAGATAAAGSGIHANLLGADADGSHYVVTYAGWPLYRYLPDVAGQAAGQAVNLDGGFWYLLRSDGSLVVPAGDPTTAQG